MSENSDLMPPFDPNAAPGKRPISPPAERALKEAEDRRRSLEASRVSAPAEIGGRGGLDPIRYGDWEKAGLISDF